MRVRKLTLDLGVLRSTRMPLPGIHCKLAWFHRRMHSCASFQGCSHNSLLMHASGPDSVPSGRMWQSSPNRSARQHAECSNRLADMFFQAMQDR